jgi:hypothetical protein
MVDVVSLVIAVISLAGTIVSAGIAASVTLYTERWKRRSEAEKVIAKYRDPLLLASKDLQSRIYNIINNYLLYAYQGPRKDHVTIYTAFLVGQYLCWTYILRRQVQFLRFSTDESNNQRLNHVLNDIEEMLSTSRFEEASDGIHEQPVIDTDEALFSLWRSQQIAIGEVMTVRKDNELVCMGYAEFFEKFKTETTFKKWFEPITTDIDELAGPWLHGTRRPAPRLRRVQHLLMDLIDILDPHQLSYRADEYERAKPKALRCICTECERLHGSVL